MALDVETLRGRRQTDRWNRMAIGDVFERLAWSHPDREAIVGWSGAFADDRFSRVTYRQADAEANRVAQGLLAAGLEPGDRVLLYCDNSVEALLTLFGIAKAGMVATPVNPMLAPEVVEAVVERVEPKYAVVDACLWPKAAAPFAAAGLSPDVTIGIGGSSAPGTVDFTTWVDAQRPIEPDVEIHADDVWSFVFTSGTTALPKAAMFTHAYSYLVGHSYALTYSRGIPFEDELRLLTFLPIVYHCGHNSCVFSAFFAGGTSIIGRRPEARAVAQAVTAERATAMWGGSPLFLDRLARVAEEEPDGVDLRTLRVALYSWGAMAPSLHERLRRHCGDQLQVVAVFGQTEAMSCFRFWPAQDPELFAATAPQVNVVGRANPLLGAAIMDPDGEFVTEEGVPGEAVYRSPCVTAGYYRDEDATRQALAHGWFHSGDSCAYGPGGVQIMVDRLKDIVKSGGENVSSIRVEAVLAAHPAVDAVAVIGVPDDRWGEVVMAVVRCRSGVCPTEAELIAFARERLAGYETPKRVVFVDAFPETVGGKVLKYQLRERYGRHGGGPDAPDPLAGSQ